MPGWTNHEIKLLESFHESGLSRAELAIRFPRHTWKSVNAMAAKCGVWMKPECQDAFKNRRWMLIVHEHFVRRESGLLK